MDAGEIGDGEMEANEEDDGEKNADEVDANEKIVIRTRFNLEYRYIILDAKKLTLKKFMRKGNFAQPKTLIFP